MGGELTKLKIISYSDEEASESSKTGEFEVQVNPDQYKKSYSIRYNQGETPGNLAGSAQFERVEPQQIILAFTIDGTGVVRNDLDFLAGAGGAFSAVFEADDISSYVTEKIAELKSVLYVFQGETHRTPFIKVVWGEKLFLGVMGKLDITYTLFEPDGTPLRAKINLTIREHVPQSEQGIRKAESSPDLTHVRVVNEGDGISLMTDKIYGDPKYYLEVAKANGLTNFRKLMTGYTLRFPPFEKPGQ
jgi:nucleoid-associated protein YgaU